MELRQGSTASGNYSTATGNATASGDYSFATGFNNGPGLSATAPGSIAFSGYALSYAITASGYGSIAFGMTRNGIITTNNAEGAFAGGDNSSVGTGANNYCVWSRRTLMVFILHSIRKLPQVEATGLSLLVTLPLVAQIHSLEGILLVTPLLQVGMVL